jgi:hypothetical protein
MPAHGGKSAAVFAEPDGLPLDASEQPLRQNDLIRPNDSEPVELDLRSFALIGAERQYPTAVHIAFSDQHPQFDQKGFGLRRVDRHNLDLDLAAKTHLGWAVNEYRQASVTFSNKIESTLDHAMT